MSAECCKCSLILPAQMVHTCCHCGKNFCTPHLLEHDKEVEMTYQTIPDLARKSNGNH